jgi:hypothetical protein
MPRGKAANVGDTRTAANGYHYTKTVEGWRLTHHIKMEEHLGRPLKENERVEFIDSSKKMDFSAKNLRVTIQCRGSSLF